MSLLTYLDAFYLDHRQCAELDAGVDGPTVWIACDCGACIARRGRLGARHAQALAQGTTDPAILADLARGRPRGKLPALRAALAGRFRSHHAFLVGRLLGHLD